MAGRHRTNRDPDLSRRRFLAILAGVAGVGTVATALRSRLGSTTDSSPPSTSPPRAQADAPGTSGPAAGPSTTQSPTTTEPAVDTTTSTTEATTTNAGDGPVETTTPTTEAPTTTTAEPPVETTTTPTTQATTTTAVGAASLLVLEKQAWGAQPEGSGFVGHSVNRITVHHTGTELGNNSKAPARIRQHQNYHLSQGWPDLAYHVMIDRAGNLYEGRPLDYRGDTFTSYDPTGHFLPCLEGNYNTETPTEAQIEALAQVCAWASSRWGIDPAAIGGHKDYASTSCPGSQLYDDISGGSLASRVNEIVASGAPSLSYLRGEAAVAAVAAIESGA